jgi:translation initiation factor IF-2
MWLIGLDFYTRVLLRLLQISSLRRVKDNVEEVNEGLECGVGCEGFLEWQEKDSIECYQVSKGQYVCS